MNKELIMALDALEKENGIDKEIKMCIRDRNEKDREMLEDSKLSIIETLNNSGFDAQKYFKDVVEYNIYNTGLKVKDTLGDVRCV